MITGKSLWLRLLNCKPYEDTVIKTVLSNYLTNLSYVMFMYHW